MPVADERLSSSTYGACGSVDKSALLLSDAEQMFRVRMSMAHTGLILSVSSFATESLSEEASLVSHCVFDELCFHYPDVKQLLRILSQDRIRSWDRLRNIKESLEKCQTEEIRKWTSQHVVLEFASVSLTHMVVSFPSDAERRIQLTREGVLFGDSEGVD